MRNLSDALRTVLEPHHRVLKQAAQRSIQGFIASAAPPVPSSTLSAKQQNRQRRYSLYEEMKALADGGTSQSDIARQLDLSLRTVQRWTRAGVFPERTPRSYPHSVDAYVGYLDQRLHQGCYNVSQLWRELRQQGYRGQLSSVWNWLYQHRGHTKRATILPSAKLSIRTSPQHTTWLILKEPPSAKAYLEELCRASPEIATLAHLGREFFRRVRSRDLAAWPQWLECARHTPAWLRIQPPARSAYRRSGTDSALEQRPGRRACAPAQADQTADVRTCQLRSVTPPCSPSGLISRCSERDARTLHHFTKSAPEPLFGIVFAAIFGAEVYREDP